MGGAAAEAHDGWYRFAGSTSVAGPLDEVRAALVEPARLARWLPGADSVEVGPDGEVTLRLHLAATHGGGPSAFRGRGEVASDGRVLRSWVLVGATGAPDGYRRDVAYRLTPTPGGTDVGIEVTTHVPGASRRALAAGGRAEARGLDAALESLGREVAGRPADRGWRPRRRAVPIGPL